VAWRRSEGPAGQGLALVKAGAASEDRAHAARGLRGGKSTKVVRRVGSTVVGAVPSTLCCPLVTCDAARQGAALEVRDGGAAAREGVAEGYARGGHRERRRGLHRGRTPRAAPALSGEGVREFSREGDFFFFWPRDETWIKGS